jgi:hypothetical protein
MAQRAQARAPVTPRVHVRRRHSPGASEVRRLPLAAKVRAHRARPLQERPVLRLAAKRRGLWERGPSPTPEGAGSGYPRIREGHLRQRGAWERARSAPGGARPEVPTVRRVRLVRLRWRLRSPRSRGLPLWMPPVQALRVPAFAASPACLWGLGVGVGPARDRLRRGGQFGRVASSGQLPWFTAGWMLESQRLGGFYPHGRRTDSPGIRTAPTPAKAAGGREEGRSATRGARSRLQATWPAPSPSLSLRPTFHSARAPLLGLGTGAAFPLS